MGKTFAELTDCDDGAGGAGAWMPTEYYVDLILEGIQTYGDLSGKAAIIGADLAAGNGDTVNIRYVQPRDHACSATTCGDCLSTTSTTFGDYSIDVSQYGDYDKIAEYADWQAKGDVMGAVANEMSKRMAHCRDKAIWEAIVGATPNTTLTTSASWSSNPTWTGSCCSFGFNIYNRIIDARQHLIGDGYDPDYVLIHPYVASYLYYKEGTNSEMPIVSSLVEYDKTGHVSKIAGLKVIEVAVAVDDDSDPSAGGDELAFVIDSRRAVAEVWGMRPKFHEFYDGVCNATELTLWTYWGTDSVDDDAIVEITNP